jgi:hypothetical protein
VICSLPSRRPQVLSITDLLVLELDNFFENFKFRKSAVFGNDRDDDSVKGSGGEGTDRTFLLLFINSKGDCGALCALLNDDLLHGGPHCGIAVIHTQT